MDSQLKKITHILGQLPPSLQKSFLWRYYLSLVPAERRPHWRPNTDDPARIREYAEWELESLYNSQSIGFMAEMLPHMYPHLDTLPQGVPITVLDVGTRTGAGSSLLASLFMSPASKFAMQIDTIDLSDEFRDYQIARWPQLRRIRVGDIFDLPAGSYDVTVCSHTLEHLDNPGEFARQCARIARRYAFFYCPYNEEDPIPGHRVIADSTIDTLHPLDKKVFHSWFFRKGPEHSMTRCVFFTLPGLNSTHVRDSQNRDVASVAGDG